MKIVLGYFYFSPNKLRHRAPSIIQERCQVGCCSRWAGSWVPIKLRGSLGPQGVNFPDHPNYPLGYLLPCWWGIGEWPGALAIGHDQFVADLEMGLLPFQSNMADCGWLEMGFLQTHRGCSCNSCIGDAWNDVAASAFDSQGPSHECWLTPWGLVHDVPRTIEFTQLTNLAMNQRSHEIHHSTVG